MKKEGVCGMDAATQRPHIVGCLPRLKLKSVHFLGRQFRGKRCDYRPNLRDVDVPAETATVLGRRNLHPNATLLTHKLDCYTRVIGETKKVSVVTQDVNDDIASPI